MKRRDLFVHAGAGSLVGIAGCSRDTRVPEGRDSGDEIADTTTPGTEDDTGPDTTNTDETTDDPDDSRSTGESDTANCDIEDRPCPPYETNHDSAVCSHVVDTDAVTVYLAPNPACGTVQDGRPVDEIRLTFYNHSETELTFNPHSWSIRRHSDADWAELHQESSGGGKVSVSPDGTYSWSFVEAVESIRSDPELEPGLYAAELGVPDPGNRDRWVACIALVQLEKTR